MARGKAMTRKWQICAQLEPAGALVGRSRIIPWKNNAASRGIAGALRQPPRGAPLMARGRDYSAALTPSLAMASSTDGRLMAKIDCGLTTA